MASVRRHCCATVFWLLRGCAGSACLGSEPLNPRPKLYLPCPGAAWLSKDVEIGFGNRIGIEQRVRLVRRLSPAGVADPTVDHEMRHVNSLRRQFARHALRQSTKGELAHRERR